MRRFCLFLLLIVAASASALVAQPPLPPISDPPQEQASPPAAQPPAQQPPQSQQPPGSASTPQENPPPVAPPAPPRRTLSVVVLDPGHGGADYGARGTAAVEKDIVLWLAKATRADLERLGFHVVMTRQADEDPSYDDRAATANAQRDAIFITFHVSSTGQVGTTRTYFYYFEALAAAAETRAATSPHAGGPLRWEEAQLPFADSSHKLADLVQSEFARTFPGSPKLPTAIPERALRSVATPAVAVEISSIGVADPQTLLNAAAPLADAIGRAAAAFRVVYEAEMK